MSNPSSFATDSLLVNKKDIDEIPKVNMHNLKNKMSYLIHKLQEGKKYYYNDHRKFLEYIIIGSWSCPPQAAYLFKKNNEYIATYSFKKKEIGKWRFSANGLEFYCKGQIKKYKIIYFHLNKDKDGRLYYFSILFDDQRFILNIDTDLAEIWDKEPPIK